jgi:hypothetical protein
VRQPPQKGEVFAVHVAFFGRLEHLRDLSEAGIGEEHSKRRVADEALPDMRMSVDATTKVLLGVIEVEAA